MVDLSKYHAKFFAEARNNMADLEASVAAIKTSSPSKAQIEDGFRGAHSIKGAAGMFGFDRVTAVAVETEAVLYALMNGAVTTNAPIAEALARAHGVLAQLLAAEETKVPAPAGLENDVITTLSSLYPSA
jgi:two-component system, chemotaxis family, sensor kinase CheA